MSRASRAALPWIVVLPLALVAVPDASASCVSQISGFSSTGQDSITFSGVSSTMITNATSYWSACGTLGQTLPSMSAGTGGDLHVTIVYHQGQQGSHCGLFTPGSNGNHMIELWDQSTTSSGSTYECNVEDTLAHEMGHPLGLDNSTCDGYLMAAPDIVDLNGTLVAQPRAPQSGECSMADSNWLTQWEKDRLPDPENPRDHGPCAV